LPEARKLLLPSNISKLYAFVNIPCYDLFLGKRGYKSKKVGLILTDHAREMGEGYWMVAQC
jgi:hypothetical protein